MSEPVTIAEVEDVLSSIRRLVSEDKRPLQASGTLKEAASEAAAPQLAPQSAPQSAAQAGEEGGFKSARATSSEDFAPHSPLRSAPTGAPHPAPDGESTSTFPNAASRPLNLTEAMQTDDADSTDAAERPFVSARRSTVPPVPQAPSATSDRLMLTPALRVATSDGKDRPQPAAIAPAKVSPLDYDMLHDDPSDLHTEDYSDQSPDVAAKTKAPVEAVAAAAAKATSGTRSDKLAALETAIGKITDDWDPDSPGDNDYSGTEPPAMEWKDDVDLDVSEAPVDDTAAVEAEEPAQHQPVTPRVDEQVRRFADSGPRVADPAATAPEFGYTAPAQDQGVGGDDQFLDEEALRDLVTEIVRAELQGALGERITRNVRKLVRREIHRALTAQDLE